MYVHLLQRNYSIHQDDLFNMASKVLYYFIQFSTHMTFLHFQEIPKNRKNQE